MEAQARANQVLPQIATLTGIDLAARIDEVVIFDEGAELRIPIVICACDYLPRKIRVVFPSASVDWDTTGYGVLNLDPGRFGIVNADPAPGIRLKSSKRESPDEVPHKRARIYPTSHVALCN